MKRKMRNVCDKITFSSGNNGNRSSIKDSFVLNVPVRLRLYIVTYVSL